MIRDLVAEREMKENDLKYARNLLTMLNKFFNETIDTYKIVNDINLETYEEYKSGFINSIDDKNSNRKSKIRLALRNTNNLIEKIENKIRDIDNRMNNMEEDRGGETLVREEEEEEILIHNL